ncbi:A/G-specific adenine glycosylase [Candidatus Coxiella mudrowiae]|nr:A/G-specific adenine glycosylase [Candidatus Coxiella mudrowiae]
MNLDKFIKNLLGMDSQQFSQAALLWFKRFGRHDLPWQKDTTPYRVWVSEIMLQQTQVVTVIPYFKRFMDRFPTLTTLALANIDEVLAHWSGLGYYARARNLHHTAQIIHKKYQGQFPTTVENLTLLPGIGQSTAGAILSFGMHRYAVILDGNIKRVLARYHALNIPINQSDGINLLWDLAKKYTPRKDCWNYNQAMMDIGAMICTRTKPKCALCPLKKNCFANQQARQTELPIKKPKINRPRKSIYLVLLQNTKGHILLEKRPPVGIWGGLWSFPECPIDENIESWCRTKFNIGDTIKLKRWNSFFHKFSHFELEIKPILLQIGVRASQIMEGEFQIWYKKDFPLPGGVAAPVSRLLEQLKHDK